MPTITNVLDPIRGCGKRKPGGLYLVTSGAPAPCCGLPVPLVVCPCCGQGIKFFRGFGWIDPAQLFAGVWDPQNCKNEVGTPFNCVLKNLPEKMGLMWVGEKFYSPDQFAAEAAAVGISKRIHSIPRDFKVGQTWIALAHIKAANHYPGPVPVKGPGVFMFFRPSRIEYVVTGSETTEQLEQMETRGISLVRVTGHIGEQQTIFNNQNDNDYE